MSWDESLFRAINGFAGQSAWLDELALNLSKSSLLWVPGILLTGYWLWLSWREALLGAPVLAATIGIADFLGARLKDLVARPRPCMSLLDIHQVEAACGKVFSFPSNHAINTAIAAALLAGPLSSFRLGELATGRTDRSVACVYRGPLRHGRAGRLGDRRIVRSRCRLVAPALLSCSRFNGQPCCLAPLCSRSFQDSVRVLLGSAPGRSLVQSTRSRGSVRRAT